MADEKVLEIYRQRYATFRHLDRLRWQLPLLPTLGGSSIAWASATNGSVSPVWWVILGWMFFIIGAVMEKMRKGLDKNNEVLRVVADQIGDKCIPPESKPWRSTAGLIARSLIILGVIYSIIAIYLFAIYLISI